MNLNIFSDLRKPGLVPGESLSLSTKFDSVLEKNQTYITINIYLYYTVNYDSVHPCFI